MMKLSRIRSGGCVFQPCFLNISVSLISLTSQRGQFLQEATFNYVWMKMCVCVLLIPSSPTSEESAGRILLRHTEMGLTDTASYH